jgi:predicted transcriptional regulator
MSKQKTTLYLDSGDYRRLKALAGAKGVAPAQLVREAVAEYVARHDVRRLPRSIGRFSSRRGDLSERAEELLAGLPRR